METLGQHSVHWGIDPAPPLLKNTPPPLFLAKSPLKSAKCASPPFFGNHTYILVFRKIPSLKFGLFQELQKYLSFFSVIPSYLLKVTKFLVKISQFEFLVSTEQRILVYKLFLSLNIPDFSLFFVEKLQLHEKVTCLFPSNPPLKTEVLSSLPPSLN